jgi:hypothetical protein
VPIYAKQCLLPGVGPDPVALPVAVAVTRDPGQRPACRLSNHNHRTTNHGVGPRVGTTGPGPGPARPVGRWPVGVGGFF